MPITVTDAYTLLEDAKAAAIPLLKTGAQKNEAIFMLRASSYLNLDFLGALSSNLRIENDQDRSKSISNDIIRAIQSSCIKGEPVLSRDSDGNPMAVQVSTRGNRTEQFFVSISSPQADREQTVHGGTFEAIAGAEVACQNLINAIPKKPRVVE